MEDRGKNMHKEDLESFQAATWKSLFSALDSNPHALFLFDRDLRLLALNAGARHFVRSINEVSAAAGGLLLDAFPAMSHSQVLRAIQRCMQGEVAHLDFEFSTGAGLSPYSLTFSPLIPESGPVQTILCLAIEQAEPDPRHAQLPVQQDPFDAHLSGQAAVIEDSNRHLRQEIAHRIEKNAAFQPGEAFFHEQFQNLPDPILIWGKDTDGEIRLAAANQAAAGFFGGRAQDLTGLTLEDFLSDALQFIGLVKDAYTAGDTRHIEIRFTSDLIDGEKWVLCDFVRLSDQYVLNILRDITSEKDRQRVDEDNRNQVELLRQAMTAFTSVLNLDQVMDNILEYLGKLIPHDRVILYLLEGDHLNVAAASGFSDEDDPLGMTISVNNPQYASINRNRLPIFLSNAQDYRPFESLGSLNAGKGWLGVPLLGHGQVMGYLSIYSDHPGIYESAQTRLAEIFANEASIAIENARLFQQVQQLAITDELTGAYNRRYFYELVDLELARSKRYNHPVSLLMIDLDNFKTVNDRFGHATGDQVLKGVAEQIQRTVRECDTLGRYGGEEFVLLLPETPLDKAVEVAERLRRMIEAHKIMVDGIEISITLSIGAAAIGADCKDSDALLQRADRAMYEAKAAGRNRVSYA